MRKIIRFSHTILDIIVILNNINFFHNFPCSRNQEKQFFASPEKFTFCGLRVISSSATIFYSCWHIFSLQKM